MLKATLPAGRFMLSLLTGPSQNEARFLHTRTKDLQKVLVRGCGFYTFKMEITPRVKVRLFMHAHCLLSLSLSLSCVPVPRLCGHALLSMCRRVLMTLSRLLQPTLIDTFTCAYPALPSDLFDGMELEWTLRHIPLSLSLSLSLRCVLRLSRYWRVLGYSNCPSSFVIHFRR